MVSSGDNSAMISHAVNEIQAGMTVNLGIGLPTRIIDYIKDDFPVCLHSENGITGVGPAAAYEDADRNLIDAGGTYVSPLPGTAFLDSAASFSLVRSGRLDLTILGALQVAENGDLANWTIPGKFTPGPGGAIELAQKARRVVILTTHLDRQGKSKIVKQCTLPLTATACVDRIYTNMAVMDVTPTGLVLREIAEGYSVDDVVAATDARLDIPDTEISRF